MKIRKGMNGKYSQWLERRRKDSRGQLMMDSVNKVGGHLDRGGFTKEALALLFILKRVNGLTEKEYVQVALAIVILHTRGDEFRFQWNKYHRGEEYAQGQELSDKRLYDPSWL